MDNNNNQKIQINKIFYVLLLDCGNPSSWVKKHTNL